MLFALAGPVAGHASDHKIVVEPPVVAPGEPINVHGDALWTEAPVAVDLVGPDGGRFAIGEATTSPDGRLEVSGSVPPGIPDGTYRVEVTSFDDTASVELIVAGSGQIAPLLALGALGAAAEKV